jgi:K+-transporting ATPase KdpF subunit
MDWTFILAAALAGLLGVYLFVALLKPEWFS